MVRSVAAIAKRDQIRRFIGSTSGSRNQMMNVGFAPGTRVTARPASVAVSGKYNISDVAPSLVQRFHGFVERWLVQLELPGRVESVNGRTCGFYRRRFILATSPSRAVGLL